MSAYTLNFTADEVVLVGHGLFMELQYCKGQLEKATTEESYEYWRGQVSVAEKALAVVKGATS